MQAGGTRIAAMHERDLDRVLEIERASFPSPWQRVHFEHELQRNPHALNRVLLIAGQLAGYACLWHLADEMTLNNIAVAPELRREGLGRLLLEWILEEARRRGCARVILDVRPSNRAARCLYDRLGFAEVGRRKNYYQIEGEDSIIMVRQLGRESPSG